jgi:hypothetical protein
MKKQLLFILSLLLISVIFSCRKAKKDMKDYYPTVNTVSATITEDGDVIVEAEITSSGEKSLEHIGFCMDTVPVPKMLSNQVVVSTINGGNFSAKYSNINSTLSYNSFNPNKTYYFRSWATNGNGYTYGNIISLNNIKSTPVIPTCTLAPSYLNLGTGNGSSNYYTVTSPSQNSTWDFQASSNSSGTLNFKFGSQPRNKVFTTTTGTPNLNQVNVSFYSGFISGTLNSGTYVYVNEISTGVYDITICQAPWLYNSTTFYLNTRFTCPT